jgi:autotransporter-associated beta strand protein
MHSHNCSILTRAGVARVLLAVIAALVSLLSQPASAALKSWNGSLNGNWSTAGNWDPAGAPANGDTLSFPALGGGAFFAMTNNLAGRRFESVNFNAGGYTLRGNAIGVTNGLNSFNGAGVNTVFVDVALGAAQTFNNSSPNFNLNGNIDLAGFNLTLDAGDAGDAINANGAIVGTGSVAKIGTGIGRFEGPSANTFTGTTTVSAGELRLLKSDGVTAVPGDLVVAASARTTWFADHQVADAADITLNAGAVLDLNGHADAIGMLVATSATVDLGGATLTLGNDVFASGGTTTVLAPGTLSLGTFTRSMTVNVGATLSIAANLTGGFRTIGIGTLVYAGIIKEGPGTLTLSGTNNYGGSTLVAEGRINANSDTAFGATFLPLATPGSVIIRPAGLVTLNSADIGNRVLIVERPDSGSALTSSGVSSWSGPIILNTNAQFTTGGTLALSNSITGPGGLTLASSFPAAVFRLAGTNENDFAGPVLLRNGTLELAKTGGLAVLAVPHGLTIGDPGDSANTKTVRYLEDNQVDGLVTIHCNGILDLNNNGDAISGLTMAGGTVNTGTGTLVLAGNLNVEGALSPCDDNTISGRLSFGSPGPRFINMPVGSLALGAPDLTLNAILGGLVEVRLSGNSGRVFLNGANTFTGLLRLASTSGDLVVRLNNPAALGATGAGTVLEGVLLELGGFNFAAEPITNDSAATLVRTIGNNNHGGPIVLNAPMIISNTAAITDLSGQISGFGSLRKRGSGTLRFSGGTGNVFGTMFVDQGLFEMNKSAGLRAAHPLVIGDGVNPATARNFQDSQTDGVTVNYNSLWDLNGNNDAITLLALDDGGDVTTGAGIVTVVGDVTVTGGTLSLGDTVSTISGNLSLGTEGTRTYSVAERSSIIIGSDPTELVINAVVSGSANINKVGPGDLSLTAANTFTGNVTVSDGELLISNDDALGSTIGSTTLSGDALLGLSGNITVTGESLTLNTTGQALDGAVHNTGGSNHWTGSIFLTQTAVIKVETNTVLVLSGALNGDLAGTSGVTKTGSGRLEFAGGAANTYRGVTRVNDGTLELRRVALNVSIPGDLVIGDGIGGALSDVVRVVGFNQIANLSDVSMDTSGLLDLNDVNEGIGTLSGSGRVDMGAAGTGGLVLNGNASTEYSGLIVGAGLPASALRKRGTGTFTLSANNTYTGTNLVEQGTMLVNGTQGQSPFVVSGGATLGGNGRIGILDVNNLGNLAPGTSPGRLTSGNSKLDPGSNFRVEINGPAPGSGHDQLNVIGSVDLNGAQLLVTKGPEFSPTDGQTLVILNNDGADAVTGAFGGLTEGAVFSVGGTSFRISYAGGTGNDVTLTVTNIPLRFASARVESGNGNGRLEPDECDHLFITLENATGSAIAGINTRLDSLTPGVAVTQPDSAYPNIPALGFGTNVTPFQIRVAPNLLCGQNVRLALVVSSASSARFTVPVTLPSGVPGTIRSFGSTNIPKAVLSLQTTNSIIDVPFAFHLAKVRLSVHITHAAVGDLRLRLQSPFGTIINLSTNHGGTGDNYGAACNNRTLFDDDAPNRIATGAAPFTGEFTPDEPLARFIGEDSHGIWRLLVEDNVAGIDGAIQCWSLTLTAAECNAASGGGCESCLATVAGNLTGASPTMPQRLLLNGVPSGCGVLKPCPTLVNIAPPLRYHTHAFTNTGPDTCVTVVLNVPCPASTNFLQSAAYLTSFDPSDLCANYLGDSGAAAFGGSAGYNFRVPAGARFVVVVNEPINSPPSQGCGSYTLDLYGLPCPPPTLFIEKVPAPPNRVRLHWSTAYPEFQLQRAATLNGAPPFPFANVPGAPFVIDGDYTVTNSATANDDYFRLRKP